MAVYSVKVQRHRPHEYPEPPAQKPDLLASVQQAMGEEDRMGNHHPLVTLTKTHTGHLAQLHTVGESLDNNLTITDSSGQVKAGVGIRFQEERNYGIYVAGLTPKGPAEASGMIQVDDILINIDGYNIQPHDRIETVRQLALGPPASIVTMTFEHRPKTGDPHMYTVQLKRSGQDTTPGFVGLVVTQEPPHAVREVHDLVDTGGIVQGAPGYHNERVEVGDFIMAINGQDVRRLPLDDLHALLRGELHSTVDIMLQRKQTMAVYGVKVQRHRPHEYPEPPVLPAQRAFEEQGQKKQEHLQPQVVDFMPRLVASTLPGSVGPSPQTQKPKEVISGFVGLVVTRGTELCWACAC
jgi:membrane-associated protease RseP (regulator of RpoE activity)